MNCMNENYTYRTDGKRTIIYNSYYENTNLFLLLVTAIIELFLPDKDSFDIPVAIEIFDTNKKIVIDKKLNVTGSNQYNYFIPRKHYEKWKRSYAIALCLMITLHLLISALVLYIFVVPGHFNPLSEITFLIVLAMLLLLILKFWRQRKIIAKYEIR